MTHLSVQKATFGAGCFWHVEAEFSSLAGVIRTEAGYSGGRTERPTYQDVCSQLTGHAEVVEVTFDPAVISYESLLQFFWEMHDPTQLNRQGPDFGTNYRSVIFCHSAEQLLKAEASRTAEDASGRHRRPVVTEIKPADMFWPAEEYHQHYLQKRGRQGCQL